MRMDQRLCAYQCLCAIMLEQKYSNLVLRQSLQGFAPAQRPYITRLVYGTLEQALLVRYQWEDLATRSPKGEAAILLDMAVYELLWMDTQPYAVIDACVRIAKRRFAYACGMVNALLRRVTQRGQRPLPADSDAALSLETSHPLWLIKMWNAQYGKDVCTAICKENMKAHKSCARVNTLHISREELLRQDSRFQCGTLGEDSVYYQEGNIADTLWYQKGMLAIQDEASQLVAPFLQPKPQERILDVCSAPGTKATHMAQLMNNQGFILCGDLHPHRVKLILEGAKRLGITCIEARCMDASVLEDLPPMSFDRVLCDVPCSGYGTLSRKSDIKYRMQSTDMDTLIPLQAAILERSAQMLKVGGVLVYSTCTLNKKENEKQVAHFLKEHEEFSLIEEQTIFPFTYGTDGFYMAKLIRIGN